MTHFNSQPHKEADGGVFPSPRISSISTHSLTRRLTRNSLSSISQFLFQLTASQGGWRTYHCLVCRRCYFNSQPHKEADRISSCFAFIIVISTHSLTRRLTIWLIILPPQSLYFNSQPHKEADNRVGDCAVRAICISTHSLTRRLTESRGRGERIQRISTHSLTRRLTGTASGDTKITVFQLTASQGGWQSSSACFLNIMLFQLTASQGGWQQFQTKTYLSKTDFSTYYTY